MGREGLGLNTTSDRGAESTPQLKWFPASVHTTFASLTLPLLILTNDV